MDYVFLSTISQNVPPCLVVSYDIACQWSVNLVDRCQVYGDNPLTRSPPMKLTFAVPKFHVPAHIQTCQLKYSFNRLPKVGRTDGESPERLWSIFNALAYSAREMGPGSRRDTLDDSFGDHNWAKITKFSESFCSAQGAAIH
jgi:hypothetical protein